MLNASTHKRCPECGETKVKALFYRSKSHKDGCSSYCKRCQNLRSTSYARENKDKIPTTGYTLKRRYGITSDDYVQMLRKQEGRCAICQSDGCSTGRNLAVDHCHTTGKIRGLLCSNCNVGLGKFKDSINIINKAIEYLERD